MPPIPLQFYARKELSERFEIDDSITVGLIARSLLRIELFLNLLKSVIPEWFYRESRRDLNWTPRLKHSG